MALTTVDFFAVSSLRAVWSLSMLHRLDSNRPKRLTGERHRAGARVRKDA